MGTTLSAKLILIFILQVNGLYVTDLYPFGLTNGDQKLSTDYDEDTSSPEIKLGTNVKFFSREFGSIFVSKLLIEFSIIFNVNIQFSGK